MGFVEHAGGREYVCPVEVHVVDKLSPVHSGGQFAGAFGVCHRGIGVESAVFVV